MDLEERIKSFASFGEILRSALDGKSGRFTVQLNTLIENQQENNSWFTPENVRYALNAIARELNEENLRKWTDCYPQLRIKSGPVRAGVIMAGNIPLAGFHDFLSVLISGNNLIAKTSSKDAHLIQFISEILCNINPGFSDRIKFTDGTLTDFDVIIATGSNNSSRYFESYFSKFPNIIRKNRNSTAVLTGNETGTELEGLGDDIFSYFGLGCRNVSKIYIPKGYNLSDLTRNWKVHTNMIRHRKYANNYDFSKAVFLVNKEVFFDTGYLLMKEDTRLSSPVSVLYYEYYESQDAVKQQLEALKENIQCVVGIDAVPFGQAQSPHLWDYADGVDTIEFLLKKNLAGIL
jgi:hypothetical protein